MNSDAEQIASEAAPAGQSKLQWRILIGFVAGLVAGLLAYTFARDASWIEGVVDGQDGRELRLAERAAGDVWSGGRPAVPR